jgi:hypothetical protein
MQDAFGNPVHCASMAAVQAYDRAVDSYLHALPGVFEGTEEALAHDPGFALAHVLRGLACAMYGRGDEARQCLSHAREGVEGASDRERDQVGLIGAIIEGRGRDALSAVERHTSRYPTDVVAIAPAVGAYGLFAFSGREDHDAARLAFVGHNAHMVMHAFYEKGDPVAAQAFLASWLPSYPDHALMWGHLQWHWALAELAMGRDDLALQRLLGPILDYIPRGTPFMALPDTVALLWRLGLRGTRTCAWSAAREHARRHFPKGSNPFGELHLSMLAAAHRERGELEDCERRLESMARAGHQGAEVVRRWAAALKALIDGDTPQALKQFDACCAQLPCVGGSHAQRSIVEETRAALRLPLAAAA